LVIIVHFTLNIHSNFSQWCNWVSCHMYKMWRNTSSHCYADYRAQAR